MVTKPTGKFLQNFSLKNTIYNKHF